MLKLMPLLAMEALILTASSLTVLPLVVPRHLFSGIRMYQDSLGLRALCQAGLELVL